MVQPNPQPGIIETLRQAITSVLGAPPDPTALEPKVLETVDHAHFRRERIKYAVSPIDSAYAHLIIPKSARAPMPVIICHHSGGNFSLGKDEIIGAGGDETLSIGAELARLGFAVFAPDAVGYGERRAAQSTGEAFDAAYTLHQHTLLLLRGETLLKKLLWDIARGVDYLETRSEINAKKIGFFGQGAYGGKMALWSAALEPRIVAAAAHGGIVSYREIVRRGSLFMVEFVVPRLMQVADLHHLLALVAPRPFLISHVAHDPQSADAGEIFHRAVPAYQKMGAPNCLSYYMYPKGIGFEKPMRYNLYGWLASWLMSY
ncbi:MAG: prolyl oligopeptidase family serine peptidase [Anaerolineae bacterium]